MGRAHPSSIQQERKLTVKVIYLPVQATLWQGPKGCKKGDEPEYSVYSVYRYHCTEFLAKSHLHEEEAAGVGGGERTMMVRTTVTVMVRMAIDGHGGDSDYMVMRTMMVMVETMVVTSRY